MDWEVQLQAAVTEGRPEVVVTVNHMKMKMKMGTFYFSYCYFWGKDLKVSKWLKNRSGGPWNFPF